MTLGLITFMCGILILAGTAAGQTEFDQPWLDSDRPFIIDAYWRNTIDFEKLATFPRVVGIIHKATECKWNAAKGRCDKNMVDPAYHTRKAEALRRGYLWGSFHFGRTGRSGRLQADDYLDTAKPADSEFIALDVDGVGGSHMKIPEAVEFIERVYERTGRYPVLYTVGKVVNTILTNYGSTSVFGKTPLWYVRYCNQFHCFFDHGRSLWPTYTLIQFASEQNCPTKPGVTGKPCRGDVCPTNKCPIPAGIPGTKMDIDVNIYNGSTEELRRKWPFTYRQTTATQ
jgi:lysozyme